MEVVQRIPTNIKVFTSGKAGSGKSFITSNVATILAKYAAPIGQKKPTVLVVEGDLQTLSVSTLFGVADKKRNLNVALRAVSKIVTNRGRVIGSKEEQEQVNEIVKSCCLRAYEEIDNLAVLGSASFPLQERARLSPFVYYQLLHILSSLFDYVLVDCNSAVEHRTTGPIFQDADTIYMIVSADYDGVRIADKVSRDYKKINMFEKIRYILNKCPTKAQLAQAPEKMEFDPKEYFESSKIVAEVPFIDQIVQYNHINDSRPIVMTEDSETLLARIAFTTIASEISPMTNYDSLTEELITIKK